MEPYSDEYPQKDKQSIQEILAFYKQKRNPQAVNFSRKPRKKLFVDSAKEYFESIHNDQERRRQFDRRYKQHLETKNRVKGEQKEKKKQQRTRRKAAESKSIISINALERKQTRNSSRQRRSHGSVNYEEEPSSKQLKLVNCKDTSSFCPQKPIRMVSDNEQESQSVKSSILVLNSNLVPPKVPQSVASDKVSSKSAGQLLKEQQSQGEGKPEQQLPEMKQQQIYYLQQLCPYDKTLLRVQQKIDKHLLYNYTIRHRRGVYLDKLLSYLTEDQGFLFNRKMLEELMALNPQLYEIKQGLTKITFVVSGVHLTDQTVPNRRRSTIMGMYHRMLRKENTQFNELEVVEMTDPFMPSIFENSHDKIFDRIFPKIQQ